MSTIVRLTIKGTTYCYRSTTYKDPATKKSKTKRILIGKIDPETGLMVPTQPRGKAKPKHAEEYAAAIGPDGPKPDMDVPYDNEVSRVQCEELKLKLLETQRKLVETERERDAARRKLSQLSKQIGVLSEMAREVESGS